MNSAPATEFLRISDLHAFYGESHVLHGIDLTVNRGELVTLLGRSRRLDHAVAVAITGASNRGHEDRHGDDRLENARDEWRGHAVRRAASGQWARQFR